MTSHTTDRAQALEASGMGLAFLLSRRREMERRRREAETMGGGACGALLPLIEALAHLAARQDYDDAARAGGGERDAP
jgi:hypothetical protein